ncbi:LLM class flavin-dependent oxidoreductase [Microlunatus sp. Y2014]|uniref:LLM class flavin-dependent oxidoreductase n=1 Tax=Microlunatus sp. Y2014 TaxID=3418488 RepID=UPI003DA795C8
MPSVPSRPQTWLLGSSPNGSNLAAGLGIGYTFAGFINPAGAAPALRHYRETFQPRGFGLDSPRAILAVNVAVGHTMPRACTWRTPRRATTRGSAVPDVRPVRSWSPPPTKPRAR